MDESTKPECFVCEHFLGVGPRGWCCEAYLETIPVDILSRRRRHVTPAPGDQGIRFKKKDTQEAAEYTVVSTTQQVCVDCVHYVRENGCRIVLGTISPFGWCPGYKSRASRQDAQEKLVRAAGVMICTKAGKVLLLRRADSGQWAFPGGHIEDGETAEQAAVRECEEETGFTPQIASEWTRRVADNVDFTTFFALVNDEFEPEMNDEHTAFKWFPVDDLASKSLKTLEV